jgi:ATP-dependent Lon protease
LSQLYSIFWPESVATLTETVKLPVLPLDDVVVLPGMVVPMRLADAEVRAAVDAARAAAGNPSAQPGILLVPRLDGKYASVGTWGLVEQIGRLPGGEQAAVVRGTHRMRIGAGTTGPGATLWVGPPSWRRPGRRTACRSWPRNTGLW